MKVLVTGADGMLGSHVVRELIKREYEVRCFIQTGRRPFTLAGLDAEFVYGDITSPSNIKNAVEGCNYIINIAALTDVWPARGKLYWDVNVDGVSNMIDAALSGEVERFIHVGSAAAFGYGTKESPGTESSPFASAKYRLDYILSKKAGQDLVLDAVKNRGLPAIILSPTFMIGAYDSKPSSGEMIISIVKGKVPGYTSGGKNWIAASDVSVAVCNALDRGEIGTCYILGNRNLSYKEAFKMIAEVSGSNPPSLPIPDFAVKTGGLAGSFAGFISGKKPRLNFPMARISCDGHYFSGEKAVKELGLPQTDIKKAVYDALEWFKSNGYLEDE